MSPLNPLSVAPCSETVLICSAPRVEVTSSSVTCACRRATTSAAFCFRCRASSALMSLVFHQFVNSFLSTCDAFGRIETALSKNISVFQSSPLKVAAISPNALYDARRGAGETYP